MMEQKERQKQFAEMVDAWVALTNGKVPTTQAALAKGANGVLMEMAGTMQYITPDILIRPNSFKPDELEVALVWKFRLGYLLLAPHLTRLEVMLLRKDGRSRAGALGHIRDFYPLFQWMFTGHRSNLTHRLFGNLADEPESEPIGKEVS